MVSHIQYNLGQASKTSRKAPLDSKQKLAVSSIVKAVNDESKDKTVNLMRAEDALEAVKILLHTSLATMCYLRNLCPDECFRDRYFGRLPGQHIKLSYSKFIEGTYPPNIGQHHTTTKTLIRGKSDGRGDQILDWLELGVFDALYRSVLASMRVTLFVDKPSPANVVEAYTYTFKYLNDTGSLPRGLAGMEISGLSSKALAVEDVQLGVIAIVRRLVLVDQTLPALPGEKLLIQLFYTDDCPRHYEPPGFEKCDDWTIYFPKDERTRQDVLKIGLLETGFHEVGLEVTALRCEGLDSDDPDERGELPSDLHFTNKVPQEACTTVMGDASEPQSASQDKAGADNVQCLHKMLPRLLKLHPFSQDNDLVETQQTNDNTNSTDGAETSLLVRKTASLSQDKLLELSQDQAELLSSGRIAGQKTAHKRKPAITPDGDVVRCQCDRNKDEGAMLFCDYCETWQHGDCYGYSGLEDSRIPIVHACYRCLLGKSEGQLLSRMKLLCWIRRGLKVLDEDGYPSSNKDFANLLHCDAKIATAVTARLLEEGFIRASPNAVSKGFGQKGLAKYQVVTTPDIMSKRALQYLDPLVDIAQHYSVSTESTPLDYSLNFETLPAPPDASIVAGNDSILQYSTLERMRKHESNNTDDDELEPILPQISSTRLAGKRAVPPQTTDKLPAAGNPATTVLGNEHDSLHASLDPPVSSSKRPSPPATGSRVSSRKRVKSSRGIEPVDVAFDA
ncbi:MAG: hypothetical protein M1812_001347 [Candelaria pacifica]|nr:MAG: hypothetical protein M1812_001347 [Candelaria pacifica]